jgi:two-component system response regulator ResD
VPRAIIEGDLETEPPVAKILVVDDEPNIREVVSLYLRRDGHSVVTAADSGLEVCRRIQSDRRVPVVMLTARGEEEDRIVGLGIGADDYVVKPFSPRELAARVEAVLRRVNEARTGPSAEKLMVFGDLCIDPNAREVTIRNASVTLTAREFDLLHHMASHPKRVFTRDQLMETVWGYAFAGDTSTVTVHIRRLREKIEPDPARPRYLQTVWGVGYRFVS